MSLRSKTNCGFALLEILFYISLLALFSIAIINSIIVMTRAFKETAVQSEFLQGGAILERISREIRQANSIATISATSISLNTEDAGGNPATIRFTLSGTNIQLFQNDVLMGNLNTGSIIVNNLSFTQISSAVSQGIKIALSISSNHDKLLRVNDFYDTVVLRGSYE